MSRRLSSSRNQPLVYISPLFGEIPFLTYCPSQNITMETHLFLPMYQTATNQSNTLWSQIFPYLGATNITELTRLYSFTTSTTLSLIQSLPQVESSQFFRDIFPIIASLAAIHPKLFQNPLPLPITQNSCLKLTRLQVASLFALSFLGVFRLPLKFQDAKQFPRCLGITDKVAVTKFRCYMAYFSTIGIAVINNDKTLQEVVTYQRVTAQPPTWGSIDIPITNKIDMRDGLIEDEPKDVFKSVFSSKAVGGNVLIDGCSQEEILFIKCPECLVAMLITPFLGAIESFRIYNVIQYADVVGYAGEITFNGNIASQKRIHNFLMFDALICVDKKLQYTRQGIDRELNKVYSAINYLDDDLDHMMPFSTGKWGCGSMLGDPRLKFLIQLMASSVSGRMMKYHPMNDPVHEKEVLLFLHSISSKVVTVRSLYNYIIQVSASNPELLLSPY
ncbi:poly ADP-ribose glycohydrolase, putative [Entamoeba invadens IP1]|uniref:poly(ADP-ribose) glycohydrolase n=1 Tax=Entamoeba invadens IP1 TaxID=370355 RepID=A0A0A1TUM5_ENTIV|nr:poly ADP-ribose glycohydrolase, putative [Entamoeba invadens IP1]ELP83782.1 poly ADP-ribose glycohydrolase, putative [Entamoeba invadens IP1]|eukprot:XP_004183128.1 poly ADP-ribose glycohydrolase, putative [Entamoeba invadens IP1]